MTLFPHRAITQVRAFLEEADPALVTAAVAAELVESFSELERLCVGGRLLFAARAAESTRWATEGHRSPEAWLAGTSHSSMGEAISTLQTADRLGGLVKTTDALRQGKLSLAQAKEVASAAEKDPGAESRLIEVARTKSLRHLRDEAKRIRLRASSQKEENERYRAIHASRYCRHWSDEEGALRLEARLTPDAGARLVSSLEKETNYFFDEARQAAVHDQSQAYRADALVALVTGDTRSRQTPTVRAAAEHVADSEQIGERRASRARCDSGRTDTLVIRVDAPALRRGYAKPGELCEIPGVGPVPVANARKLLGEGFVKIVVRDAVDVLSVCHVGRTVPAHVQSALEERDPTCVVCDCGFGLENHHFKADYAKCKTTSLDGLARVCKHHHDLITYEGFKLVGGPGAWELVSPPAQGSPPAPKFPDTG